MFTRFRIPSRLASIAAVVVMAAAVFAVPAPAVSAQPVRAAATTGSVQVAAGFDMQMVALMNRARLDAGLRPVQVASGLGALSTWWSKQLATGVTGGRLQHNPNAFTQVTHYGAANRTAWGENVAKFPTSATARQVFDAYMASPPHRANILSPRWRYVGVGAAATGDTAFSATTFTDLVEARTVRPTPKPAPPLR